MAQQIINVGSSPNDGTGDVLRNSQIKANANFTELYNAVDLKLDKVSTTGVERVYTINADGSQGTKPTSDFKDVINGYFNGTNFYTDSGFTNLITSESGKIYVALDTNFTYRWSGSAYVQIGGGVSDMLIYSISNLIITPTDNYRVANQTENLWQIGLTGLTLTGYNLSTYSGNHYVAPYDCKIKEVIVSFQNNSGSTTDLSVLIHTHVPLNGTSPKVMMNKSCAVSLFSIGFFSFSGADIDTQTILKGRAIMMLLKNNLATNNTIRQFKCYVILEKV